MSDLTVKFAMLHESQLDLNKIMKEFEHATDHVQSLTDIWADDDVAGAMHGFATDWKDHRAKLLEKMQKVVEHSEKCLTTWEAADTSLAASVSSGPSTQSTTRGSGSAGRN